MWRTNIFVNRALLEYNYVDSFIYLQVWIGLIFTLLAIFNSCSKKKEYMAWQTHNI